IQHIVRSGTGATSELIIKVTRAGGNGTVSIGSITGGTIGKIVAPQVNLNGDGVILTGQLGQLVIHDLINGADVRAGGKRTQQTSVTADYLGDGTVIAVASTLKALNLGNVARAEIRAPAVTSLVVAGDFFGDLVLTGLAGSTLPALGSA